MNAQWTFITVAAETQTNAPIPPDYKRFLPNTFFNRTQERPLIGPVTPQVWQQLIARPALSTMYIAFRERLGAFIMNPIPTAGETIAYEYISSYWALSSSNVAKSVFTSDDDTSYLDEELVKLGLRWRWKKEKGLPYAEDMDTYLRAVQEAVGNDGGNVALDMGGQEIDSRFWEANIQEGNFPGWPS